MEKRRGYEYSLLQPLPDKSVTITGGHWHRVIQQSVEQGLPKLYKQYENRNIVKNFIAAGEGKERSSEENAKNYDEFLYKAMEAGAYRLNNPSASKISDYFYRIKKLILDAQQPDGYIVTEAISRNRKRFSEEAQHEMYNAGHLIQAGIAERRTTGDSSLFEAGQKYIDLMIKHYADQNHPMHRFRGKHKWPDHPNLEMALVELYRETGDGKYLEFCREIMEFSDYPNRTQMMHHAIMELLHAAGGIDYYLASGETEYRQTTERLWKDLLKKTYITGAYGSVTKGAMLEAIGKDFQLTNHLAYAETCASVSMVFLSWNMFLAKGDSRYIDALECSLYNGVQAGISRNGYEYFYENPLEYRKVSLEGSSVLCEECLDSRSPDRGGGKRSEFHRCSCCPPNVQRLFASLEKYIYAKSDEGIWINLFIDSEMKHSREDTAVSIRQKTNYPWDGDIQAEVLTGKAVFFTLFLRIPDWCDNPAVSINGTPLTEVKYEKGYFAIRRVWHDGDKVFLKLPMRVRFMRSHPKNIANYGKAVITRGPLVYCIEETDNPDTDIFGITLMRNSYSWNSAFREDLLGGVVMLDGKALLRKDGAWDEKPYKELGSEAEADYEEISVRAIPYYAWANRGPSSMVTAFPLAAE